MTEIENLINPIGPYQVSAEIFPIGKDTDLYTNTKSLFLGHFQSLGNSEKMGEGWSKICADGVNFHYKGTPAQQGTPAQLGGTNGAEETPGFILIIEDRLEPQPTGGLLWHHQQEPDEEQRLMISQEEDQLVARVLDLPPENRQSAFNRIAAAFMATPMKEAANHRNEVPLASANANDNRRAMLSPANTPATVPRQPTAEDKEEMEEAMRDAARNDKAEKAKDCLEQGVDDFVVLHDDLANVPEHMLAASWQQDCSTPPARESDRLENLRADGVCASARRAQTEGRQDTGGGVHDAEEAANHRNEGLVKEMEEAMRDAARNDKAEKAKDWLEQGADDFVVLHDAEEEIQRLLAIEARCKGLIKCDDTYLDERSRVVDDVVFVADKLSLMDETVHKGMELVDRVSSRVGVRTIAAVACLVVAAKYSEAEHYVYSNSFLCTLNTEVCAILAAEFEGSPEIRKLLQILNAWEIHVLQVLDWRLSTATLYDFVAAYRAKCGRDVLCAHGSMWQSTKLFCDLATQKGISCIFGASVSAAAAIVAARTVTKINPPLPQGLAQCLKVEAHAQIEDCRRAILRYYHAPLLAPLPSELRTTSDEEATALADGLRTNSTLLTLDL